MWEDRQITIFDYIQEKNHTLLEVDTICPT